MDVTSYTASSSGSDSNAELAIHTAKRIAEHLRGYNLQNPRVFTIHGRRPEEIKDAFYKAGISFLELKNKKNKVLVEQSDFNLCNQLADITYYKQKCFLQEYDKGELEKLIASHQKIENKQFLQIKNLSSSELKVFLNRCNNIKPGLLLETNRKEYGEYSVSIPYALLSRQERERVVGAYIEASISAFGINFVTRRDESYTKEAYLNQLKEHRLITQIVSAIHEKLGGSGLNGDDFKEYFMSASRQTAYVLTQLQNGQEMAGFSQKQRTEITDAFSALPKETYLYTADKMKKHEITAKTVAEPKQIVSVSNVQQQEQEM